MATITPRKQGNGVSYQVKVRLKGFPTRSATFARKTDAARWASATETHLREARHFPHEPAQHTLSELIERYQRNILPLKPKNAHNQSRQLDWWNAQLGHLLLSEISPHRVAEGRDRLLATPKRSGKARSPATVVRYMAVLSHAYSVALRECGWVDENPLRRITKPKEARGRVRFLDDAERESLLQGGTRRARRAPYEAPRSKSEAPPTRAPKARAADNFGAPCAARSDGRCPQLRRRPTR